MLILENFANLVARQERKRIAQKIEQLPFGDTAASFSVYVREA
jgi:Fe-S cluster biosynthesis and repair protein YggX